MSCALVASRPPTCCSSSTQIQQSRSPPLHPISIPSQISHSKSGHSDAALRLNPPPSRNTTAQPPLRNKRALAMPWARSSSPSAMAPSFSSSRFSPSSSSVSGPIARAASTLLSSPTRPTLYLALVALCLPMALAHDHSVENIAEGDATSPEPIVRQTVSQPASISYARPQSADLTRLAFAGLDIMGSHLR